MEAAMRLVPSDNDPSDRLTGHAVVEIHVREPITGKTISHLVLRLASDCAVMPCMEPSSLGTQEAGTDSSTVCGPVAGRIASEGTPLAHAVDAWLEYLRSRRKKPRSVASFRQVVSKAMGECGWSSPADVTFAAVTSWMGAQAWKGSTYNRNLSCFRSLCRHMKRSGVISLDPLELVERAEDDGGEGARPATVDEASRIILHAWVRDQADRRCKGNRALYWLCLFSHASRVTEPSLWKRRHLVLDHPVPHVIWEPEINKGRKRRDCALAPEIVEQLRLHLAAVDRDLAAAGLAPAGPNDPVFPVVPSKGTFLADRDAAGIAAEDYRGRRFSTHSARKYFATVLGSTASEKMVDFLMRHSGRVEHRYYIPPLEEQASALSALPRLWPASGRGDGNAQPKPPARGPRHDSSPDDLTNRGDMAEDGGGTHEGLHENPSRVSSPGSAPCPRECQRRWSIAESGTMIGELMRAVGQGRLEHAEDELSPAAVCRRKSAFV
ncbi:MAG: site-specific integrase [Phycisphaerales bacterium]|nr:MAG: site-specific integrase [Phycisphaerales bacterium]